ncbi:MAG: bifunctional methylenetetrahydrofolate dehydrogenase/methenyltetrahydrofolate cyclohydrolase FolD [Pseudomonadota bacterium]
MTQRAKIIDGRAVAERLRRSIAQRTAIVKQQHGLTPGLAAVLVGKDPASQIYVRNKAKRAIETGLNSWQHRLPETASQAELLDLVMKLNRDPAVHGILVQLPLPPQIDEAAIIEAVDPAKDVDGFHPVNAGRLLSGQPGLVPCTARGCMILLKETPVGLAGRHAVVIGRSNIVGKPMALLLLGENCTVTVAHSHTRDLPGLCRSADIVVAAVGRPEMVRGEWIKPGATVIDVGISRIETINRIEMGRGKARIVGDVAFAEVKAVAGALTPVPGGVGPMTVACLLLNTLDAACAQAGIAAPGEPPAREALAAPLG